MLGIGKKFPEFNLKGVTGTDVKTAFSDIHNKTYEGKWLVLFSYPKDFTFVCPTEIKGFGDLNKDFKDRDTQVLTFSTDSEFVHLAWKQSHKDLTNLPFPMLSDIKRELSTNLGILDDQEGVAQRAALKGGIELYFPIPAGLPLQGDNVSMATLNAFLASLFNAVEARRTGAAYGHLFVTATCHGNCHGSRGRR